MWTKSLEGFIKRELNDLKYQLHILRNCEPGPPFSFFWFPAVQKWNVTRAWSGERLLWLSLLAHTWHWYGWTSQLHDASVRMKSNREKEGRGNQISPGNLLVCSIKSNRAFHFFYSFTLYKTYPFLANIAVSPLHIKYLIPTITNKQFVSAFRWETIWVRIRAGFWYTLYVYTKRHYYGNACEKVFRRERRN